MEEPIQEEIIHKTPELVLCGKSKYIITKEKGIGTNNVYRHAIDITSQKQ